MTAPDRNFKAGLRRQKKNPGSFIVSHKKRRVYIGVNLRPPAPESAIIHYKPDWPGRWLQQGQNWPAPVLVAPSTMSNGYTCKPPLSPSMQRPWPKAVWGIFESVNKDGGMGRGGSHARSVFQGRTVAKWYHSGVENSIAWPLWSSHAVTLSNIWRIIYESLNTVRARCNLSPPPSLANTHMQTDAHTSTRTHFET